MHRLVCVAALLCSAAIPATAEEKGTKYGAGVSGQNPVKVSDLLASPETYLGKTVRVDGVVQAVCQEMGCWIRIGDDAQSKGIQFKVEDGVIVFPKDGKGRNASAEGTFEKVGDGGDSKPADAPAYRIKATGAIIY